MVRFLSIYAGVSCLAILAAAQVNSSISSNTGAFENDIVLCNTTFDRANATGIFSFDPKVEQGRTKPGDSGRAPNASWAIAVAEDASPNATSPGLQLSFLYSTGGANYSDNIRLGYDVCTIALNPEFLSNNTIRRAQADNGSCLQTFDSNCVDALQTASNRYTQWIDSPSPLPNSNLTSTSLPTVCHSIAELLSRNLPSECLPFMNETGTDWIAAGFALTSYNRNDLTALSNCTVNGTRSRSFSLASTLFLDGSSNEIYDTLTSYVWPFLTIFMPTANAAVTSSIGYPRTVATCLHINQTNPGSRVSPKLPDPTPVDYGTRKGLSGGAIAGIVVGSVIGVALILLAILIFFNCCGLRNRIRRKKEQDIPPADATHTEAYPEDKKELGSNEGVEVPGNGINELHYQHAYPAAEMPAENRGILELEGTERKHELDDQRGPAEMIGDLPDTHR